MRTSDHAEANIVFLPQRTASTGNAITPTAMAQYLREIQPLDARCFALEMHERTAWANESWGEYWRDVAALV